MIGVASLALLAACARPEAPTGINDPNEAQNREIHQFNVAVDRHVYRPVAMAYGNNVPKPVRSGLDNFASNLSLPSAIMNNVLQFRIGEAARNTGRFVVNSTVGLVGFFDPASQIGLTIAEADFGETLYVWGFSEGPYVEMPFLGPSTSRDTAGFFVDFFTDPLGFVAFSQEGRYVLAVSGAEPYVDYRYENRDLIDSVLYDSADSYAQTRQIYLQNRRFELGGEAETDYFDPYEDPYADPYAE